jgi:hypothetical protein
MFEKLYSYLLDVEADGLLWLLLSQTAGIKWSLPSEKNRFKYIETELVRYSGLNGWTGLCHPAELP